MSARTRANSSDIKKLGRIGSVGHRITGRQPGVVNRHLGNGWEYVHICIDDASSRGKGVVWAILGRPYIVD